MKPQNWLKLKNIEAWICGKKIFDGLNLSLKTNENTVMLGQNGSGKSSIVKLISRDLYPVIKENSELIFFGRENMSLVELRKNISIYSSEVEKRIDQNLDVFSAIETGLYGIMRFSGRENNYQKSLRREVEELIEKLNLGHIARKEIYRLSDGQRKIVLIARALANNPKVLVLDEPSCNLDLKANYELIKMQKYLSKSSTTLFWVTHKIEEITNDIERVVFIKNGIIIGDGSPSSMLTSHKLSNLYDIPLKVFKENNYWQVLPRV